MRQNGRSLTVIAFGKAEEPMGLPLSDDTLEVGDRLAVLADFDVLEEARQLIVGETLAPEGGAA